MVKILKADFGVGCLMGLNRMKQIRDGYEEM